MDIYPYAFGAACIAVYAWGRFNTPATWRSTTTSFQYWMALSGYVLAALVLWFVLARLIETNPSVIKLLTLGSLDPGQASPGRGAGDEASEVLAQLNELSAQLLSAIILTVLLPRFPLLWKVDLALQRVFRELGAIPRRARQLSAMLRRASYEVPPDLLAEVRARLRDQGLRPERLLQSERRSPEWQWMRIVALMAKLEEVVDLQDEPVAGPDPGTGPSSGSTFVRHRELEYVAIRAAYQRQAAVAAVLFKPPAEAQEDDIAHAVLDPAEGSDLTLRRLQQSFHGECRRLIIDLTHLISCGVLRSNFSLAAAYRELRDWGFGPLDPSPRGISINDLIGLMLAITLYLFVLFLFIHGGSGRIERIPVFAVAIGLTMTAAIICALYPKKLAMAFGSQHRAGRNFGLYLLSGGMAIGCWVAIHYIRIMLTTGKSFGGVLDELYWWYPIALIPGAAAFAIAWMTDDRPDRWGLPPSFVRWGEAMILAAAFAGAAYVAVTFLRAVQLDMPADLRPPRPPSRESIVLIQAGLGFIIGALVPHLYRRASFEARGQEAADDGVEVAARRCDVAIAQGGA